MLLPIENLRLQDWTPKLNTEYSCQVMKPGRPIILLSAAVAVAVVVVAAAIWPDPEPRYNGKRLGEWLAIAFEPKLESWQRIEARAAVKSIGTNALPVLLEWIHYAPPDWKSSLADRLGKHPALDSKGSLHSWLVDKDYHWFVFVEYG